MSVVCFLSSPFQLLNAREALHYFRADPALASVVLEDMSGNETVIRQLERTAQFCGFGPPIWTPPSTLRGSSLAEGLQRIVERQKLERKMLERHRSADVMVLGNIRSVHGRSLSRKVNPKTLVIVDDGFGVPESLRLWTSGEFSTYRYFFQAGASGLRALVGGYRPLPHRPLTWFSFMDLPIGEADELVPNHYKWLRSQTIRRAAQDSYAVVVGQPLVEQGIVKQETYGNLLRRILQGLPGSRVDYIAHRRENLERLRHISYPGLRVVSLDLPLEAHLASNHLGPSRIVGFFSTALMTVGRVFGDSITVEALRIPDRLVEPEYVQKVRQAYDLLEGSTTVQIHDV